MIGAARRALSFLTPSERLRYFAFVVGRAGLGFLDVIGIGIESTEVRRFYPKHLVLNKVEDLPAVVMKELRALIVK